MTTPALLAELRRLGFALRAEGGLLLVAPPGGGRLHPDDAAVIRAAKGALLEALAAEAATARVTREVWPPDPAAWPAELAEPGLWQPGKTCPGCPWCRSAVAAAAGPCEWCDRPGEYLCDYVMATGPKAKKPADRVTTCDRRFCRAHGHRVAGAIVCTRGKGGGCRHESVDHCPDHAPKKE